MPSRSLVLRLHGRSDVRVAEAKYAVLSAHRLVRPSNDLEVVVYADDPGRFDDMPVRPRPMSEEELEAWSRGGYWYRRKLEVLRDALDQTKRPVLFVDSDTWFRTSPVKLLDWMGSGSSVTHVREGELPSSQYNTSDKCRRFADFVQGRIWRDSAGGPLSITPDFFTWNSGVIGPDPSHRVLVDDVPALIDQVRLECREFRSVEQSVTGYLLEHSTKLRAATSVLFHHWPEWFREPFHSVLLREMERTTYLPAKERTQELYPFRLRLHGFDRLKHPAKRAYRSVAGCGPVRRLEAPGSVKVFSNGAVLHTRGSSLRVSRAIEGNGVVMGNNYRHARSQEGKPRE